MYILYKFSSKRQTKWFVVRAKNNGWDCFSFNYTRNQLQDDNKEHLMGLRDRLNNGTFPAGGILTPKLS